MDDRVGGTGAVRAEQRGHPVEDLAEDLAARLAGHDLVDLGVRRGLDQLRELLRADVREVGRVEVSHGGLHLSGGATLVTLA
ncbi:hypothetical protein M5W98_30495 [Paenibacillus apiarius]|nr:hypothetical protein [Paenibacillus apiarius]